MLFTRCYGGTSRRQALTVAYYRPEQWIPHITLADGDVLKKLLLDVVRLLSERDFNWEIEVTNLSLIYADPPPSLLPAREGELPPSPARGGGSCPPPVARGELELTSVGFCPEGPDVNVRAGRTKPCGLI